MEASSSASESLDIDESESESDSEPDDDDGEEEDFDALRTVCACLVLIVIFVGASPSSSDAPSSDSSDDEGDEDEHVDVSLDPLFPFFYHTAPCCLYAPSLRAHDAVSWDTIASHLISEHELTSLCLFFFFFSFARRIVARYLLIATDDMRRRCGLQNDSMLAARLRSPLLRPQKNRPCRRIASSVLLESRTPSPTLVALIRSF